MKKIFLSILFLIMLLNPSAFGYVDTVNQGDPGDEAWLVTCDNCSGSSTVTANQGSSGVSAWSVKISQSATDNDVDAQCAQSGIWTVQPGNTANTTPWLMELSQTGTKNDVDIASALPTGSNTIGGFNLSQYTPSSGRLPVEEVGNISHDGADSGNPVKVGYRADTTFQTAVSDGDRVDALADVYGVAEVRCDHPNSWNYHENSSSALTDTTIKAAPGAGLSLYITSISVSTGAATALNFFIEEGTTTTKYGPKYLEATAGRSYVHGNGCGAIYKATANTLLSITTSAAIAHSIDIQGFIAP